MDEMRQRSRCGVEAWTEVKRERTEERRERGKGHRQKRRLRRKRRTPLENGMLNTEEEEDAENGWTGESTEDGGRKSPCCDSSPVPLSLPAREGQGEKGEGGTVGDTSEHHLPPHLGPCESLHALLLISCPDMRQ